MKKLNKDFFTQDVLTVAPNLIGKLLVRKFKDGTIKKYRITETEAYNGEDDSACHARFGKTDRNEILYHEGGYSYVYLCYGIHYLFNIVTGSQNHPEAVLIRGIENFNGPGKLTKELQIDKTLNKINLVNYEELWLEDDGFKPQIITTPRIGIDYASEPYKSIHWRFIIKETI